MATYHFAELWPYGQEVHIFCTDSEEGEFLVSLLNQIVPNIRVSKFALPSGETFLWKISGFKKEMKTHILWWLIKQLGTHGWEPIGALPNVYTNTSEFGLPISTGIHHYEFRREIK